MFVNHLLNHTFGFVGQNHQEVINSRRNMNLVLICRFFSNQVNTLIKKDLKYIGFK